MTAVVAWLWQGLLLAAVIDLLLRAMPRLNAATRHLIWWGALCGVVLLAALHAAGPGAAVSAAAIPPLGLAALAGAEKLDVVLLDIPDTLGASGESVTDVPPGHQVARPPPVPTGSVAPEEAFRSDVARLGRNSATTATAMGLSVAGTLARAGKVLGRVS